MGEGQDVQYGVGRSADGVQHADHVLQGGGGQDVAGPEALLDHADDPTPGLLGKPEALGRHGGGRPGTRQRQADRLRQTLHGIGGSEQGAGAGGGTDGFLQLREGIVGEPRVSHTAGPGLGVQIGDDHILSLVPSCQHRPTRDQDGGTVEPGRRQEMAGDVLVAATDQDQAVETMDFGAGFHIGGDDIAGRSVVAHASVSHVHGAPNS